RRDATPVYQPRSRPRSLSDRDLRGPIASVEPCRCHASGAPVLPLVQALATRQICPSGVGARLRPAKPDFFCLAQQIQYRRRGPSLRRNVKSLGGVRHRERVVRLFQAGKSRNTKSPKEWVHPGVEAGESRGPSKRKTAFTIARARKHKNT